MAVYERYLPRCPYCDFKPVPAARSGPEFVDGDLLELDAETLARMRGDIEAVDRSPELYRAELAAKGCPRVGQMAHVKRFSARQDAQGLLRYYISIWAGQRRDEGHTDAESYRKFYLRYGVDVMTAQTLKTADAEALTAQLSQDTGVSI